MSLDTFDCAKVLIGIQYFWFAHTAEQAHGLLRHVSLYADCSALKLGVSGLAQT